MFHFHRSETPKAAQIGFSLHDTRILRILVEDEGKERYHEGIGEGYLSRYLTMRNQRFRMFKYLREGWIKIIKNIKRVSKYISINLGSFGASMGTLRVPYWETSIKQTPIKLLQV